MIEQMKQNIAHIGHRIAPTMKINQTRKLMDRFMYKIRTKKSDIKQQSKRTNL